MYKKLFLIGLLPFSSLFAAYVGNASSPDTIRKGFFSSENAVVTASLGFEFDITWDRKLKTYSGVSGVLNSFNSRSGMSTLTVDLYDRVELFGKAGLMQAYFDHNPFVENQSISAVQNVYRSYQSKRDFTWAAGARAIIFQWKSFCVTGQALYQRAYLDLRWSLRDNDTTFSTISNGKVRSEEWQIALVMGRKIDFLYPYIGGKYSQMLGHVYNLPSTMDIPSFHFKSRHNAGFILGCGISTSKAYVANLELRFLDEDATTIEMKFTF